MNTLEVLKAARERIAVPERWIQQEMARDELDLGRSPRAIGAIKWCAKGAIFSVCQWGHVILQVVSELEKTTGMTLPGYNDTHSHAEVLEMFDQTIARLESESTA